MLGVGRHASDAAGITVCWVSSDHRSPRYTPANPLEACVFYQPRWVWTTDPAWTIVSSVLPRCLSLAFVLLAGPYVLRLPFLIEFGSSSSRKYRTKSYGCTEMAMFSKTLNSTGSARNMKGIEMGRTLMAAGTGADMIG